MVGATFFTWFLWVTFVVLPNSVWESTFPNHPTTFLKASPSVIKVGWYPTCVLDLGFPRREPTNTWRFTLSHFRGLFNDHTRPIIFFQLSQNQPEGLIINILMDNTIIQRTYRTFPILFYKDSKLFWFTKSFFVFFWD